MYSKETSVILLTKFKPENVLWGFTHLAFGRYFLGVIPGLKFFKILESKLIFCFVERLEKCRLILFLASFFVIDQGFPKLPLLNFPEPKVQVGKNLFPSGCPIGRSTGVSIKFPIYFVSAQSVIQLANNPGSKKIITKFRASIAQIFHLLTLNSSYRQLFLFLNLQKDRYFS